LVRNIKLRSCNQNKSGDYSCAILTIFEVAKIRIGAKKKHNPPSIFKLELTSPRAINKTGIISGKASAAIIGAAFPRIESDPQKQQIKLIIKLTNRADSKKSGLMIPTTNKIGSEQTSQLASILAAIKISKLSQERIICSLNPDSKSFFKNSAEEKIMQEISENKIMIDPGINWSEVSK
jgi:hypothetical protein